MFRLAGCVGIARRTPSVGRRQFTQSAAARKAPEFVIEPSAITYGFIGIGHMGRHMAANLIRKSGRPLVVFDVQTEAVKQFTEQQQQQNPGSKVRVAASPREVAELADVVVTMLPNSSHVEQVYLDKEKGLLAASLRSSSASKRRLLIDSSTIDPSVSKQVSERVHEATKGGWQMLDAPVSGGVLGAEAGTLTFMVGTPPPVPFSTAQSILAHMGKNIVHCGEVGHGQIAKICNNMLLGISMIAVSETLNLGCRLGMDPKVLSGIINTSSGRCWSSDTYNPVPGVMSGVPSSRGYAGGFGVHLMSKDMGLAVKAAKDSQTTLHLGAMSDLIYSAVKSAQVNGKQGNLESLEGKDFSVVFKWLDDNAKKF